MVAEHIYRDFAYPALLQQQRLWEIWDRIDDAFRVREKADNLDLAADDPIRKTTSPDPRGSGLVNVNDGVSAKVTPATLHRQIVAKTDMHMSLAWADFPVRVMMPVTVYEHPLYNPTQQSVDIGNELLQENAREISLKERDRIGRGSFAKYGHAWAAVDFVYSTEDVDEAHAIPPDALQARQMITLLLQQYGGVQPERQIRGGIPYLVWKRTVVKAMRTDFRPLRVDDVLIDTTMSAFPIENQLCPGFKTSANRAALFGNEYDERSNPFGWLNCEKALDEQLSHYTLSAVDEGQLRAEMLKKQGLSENTNMRPRDSRKQLWTFYPLLAIEPFQDPKTGEQKMLLDKGDGLECPSCNGSKTLVTPEGSATCPSCHGAGKVYIKPERYVVQMFGSLMTGPGSVTVLRVQRNPTVQDKVPLLFAAHLIEDTAGAIPISKAEASLNAHVQLTTSYNQWYDAKNQMINRPWLVQEDSPLLKMNLNRASKNLPCHDIEREAKPMPTLTFDITQNLQPWVQQNDAEVVRIMGMSNQMLGEVSAGRRAATEIQTAYDAARVPIVAEVDSYNSQMIGGWAWFTLANIEAWADRDWIRRKTGRTTFGKVQIFTATADEFMKRMGLIQNMRYVLEASVNDPTINRPVLWTSLLRQMSLPNVEQIVQDGLRKAQLDAFKIGMDILGDGKWSPPQMSDPHEIYMTIWEEMLKDSDLVSKAPQNAPLLGSEFRCRARCS
jgi:hypothetical protein